MSLAEARGVGAVDDPLRATIAGAAGEDPNPVPAHGHQESGWNLAQRLQMSRRLLAGLLASRSRPVDQWTGASAEEDLARELRLPFLPSIDPETLIVRERDLMSSLTCAGGVRQAMLEGRNGVMAIAIAPDRKVLPRLDTLIRARPALARRLRVTTRGALREAFVARAAQRLLHNACNGLFDRFPELSARIVLKAWQGAFLSAGAAGLSMGFAFAPMATTLLLHCLFTLLFFSCVLLRLAAVRDAGPSRFMPLKPVRDADLPVYSVLVALRNEAEIVPDLLVALGNLQWPRDRLEIKLVCEADDEATLRALEAQQLRPYVEVVRAPPAAPRTKPKALAYASQMISGEFVALYDAEDRPHPMQLVEAWQRFQETGPEIACLQAPLVISNWKGGILPRMFAFEYAALFRGLLPWLSRKRLMLPLGGTSNHFRKSALDEVGGWDPYNVTEDADLGLRLHRFGFRTETISRPTYEDAPDDLKVWVNQRTRWFKGWLQTWLVHMRNPLELLRELGLGSFLVTQVLFAGMVASALVHPLLVFAVVGITWKLTWDGILPLEEILLLAADALNLVCGYAAFLALGRRALLPQERTGLWKVILWTPPYWLLMSAAAWRSVLELYRRPHHWEKTPHRPHRAAMAAIRKQETVAPGPPTVSVPSR